MKMKFTSLGIMAVVSALACMPAQAATKITTVTNDATATNGCTVRSAGGYGGYNFNVVAYGIDCPNDPEVYPQRHDHWSDWGGLWCEMTMPNPAYYVTGNCGNYSIWRY